MAVLSRRKIGQLRVFDGETLQRMISIRDVMDDIIAGHALTMPQPQNSIDPQRSAPSRSVPALGAAVRRARFAIAPEVFFQLFTPALGDRDGLALVAEVRLQRA